MFLSSRHCFKYYNFGVMFDNVKRLNKTLSKPKIVITNHCYSIYSLVNKNTHPYWYATPLVTLQPWLLFEQHNVLLCVCSLINSRGKKLSIFRQECIKLCASHVLGFTLIFFHSLLCIIICPVQLNSMSHW